MLDGEQALLAVYVVWHPRFDRGQPLADLLFKTLCGDPYLPAVRALGIPVRFRTALESEELPRPIAFDAAEHTAVIVLVDNELVADADWSDFVVDLLGQARSGHDVVVPVAITRNAFNLPPEISEVVNFQRLYEVIDPGLVAPVLMNRITHDLCEILDPDTAVQVFISHAKEDGVTTAREVRQYIHTLTGLTDFFDATAIPDGSKFADVIKDAMEESALLVVHTDRYSSREWCRLEVLEAKRRRKPILVLAAAREGEARSFPYIGNVPVVCWVDGSPWNMERVVGGLLREVLRSRYFPAWMERVCSLHGLTLDRDAFSYPPELLTALQLHVEAAGAPVGQYLYPDPPLGTEELQLLTDLDPTLIPLTPTTLVAS